MKSIATVEIINSTSPVIEAKIIDNTNVNAPNNDRTEYTMICIFLFISFSLQN